MKKLLLVAALGLGLTASVWAAPKTVKLAVDGMYCPACPLTVKLALQKVKGVSQVEVSYEKKQAVVSYDDAKAKIEDLIDATTFAGYPSKVAP